MNQFTKTDLFRALESIPTQEKIGEIGKAISASTESKRKAEERAEKAEERAEKAEERAEKAEERAEKAEASEQEWKSIAHGAIQLNLEERRDRERNDARMQKLENALRGRRVERIAYAGLVQVFQLVEAKKKELGGDEVAAIGEAMSDGKAGGLIADNTDRDTFKKKLGKWRSWGRPDADGFEKRWKAMKRAEKKKPKGKPKKKA